VCVYIYMLVYIKCLVYIYIANILYSENNKNIDLLHEHKLLLEIIKTYSLKEKIDILFNISINSIFFCYYNNNNYANKLLLTILNYYIRLYNYCK
jgi:hypothetical protein